MIPAFVNGSAGTAKQARAALEDAGDFDVHVVAPAQLVDVLAKAASAGGDRIAVAGGDGTIATAAGALMTKSSDQQPAHLPALAVIPGGTLNHFARDHGIPTELPGAVGNAASGVRSTADVATMNGRAFLNTSSVGAYVVFVRIRERLERVLGYRLASLVAALRLFFVVRPVALEMEVAGERHSYSTPLVFIGVGEREMKRPEFGSRIPNGKKCLHVIVVRERRAARLAVVALEAARRGIAEVAATPDLDAFTVDSCTITLGGRIHHASLDGEIVRVNTPLVYELHRDALGIVVPAGADGARASST